RSWYGEARRDGLPNSHQKCANTCTLGSRRGTRPAPHRERLRARPCDASATRPDGATVPNPDGCVERDEGGSTVTAISLSCRVCATDAQLDGIGPCRPCFGPLDPVYDRDLLRATVTRERLASGPPS